MQGTPGVHIRTPDIYSVREPAAIRTTKWALFPLCRRYDHCLYKNAENKEPSSINQSILSRRLEKAYLHSGAEGSVDYSQGECTQCCETHDDTLATEMKVHVQIKAPRSSLASGPDANITDHSY